MLRGGVGFNGNEREREKRTSEEEWKLWLRSEPAVPTQYTGAENECEMGRGGVERIDSASDQPVRCALLFTSPEILTALLPVF